MASPHLKTFAVYNPSTGAPLAGVLGSLSFVVYKDDLGVNVTPPSITEIGGGLYAFTPALSASPLRAVAWIITTGGNLPAYVDGAARPEDWNEDLVQDVSDILLGKNQIVTVGGDANKLVLYRPDGVTVIKKFALTDASGSPSVTNIFTRTPL